MNKKYCPKCQKNKSHSLFGRMRSGKDGLSGWCSACKAADTRARNIRHPEKKRAFDADYRKRNLKQLSRSGKKYYRAKRDEFRRRNLRYLFGLTPEEYDLMLLSQGGCCAACGSPTTNNPRQENFAVDHSHATDEIRGLLCYSCNSILGFSHDSIEHLLKLIAYLARTNSSLEYFKEDGPNLRESEQILIDVLAKNGWRKPNELVNT